MERLEALVHCARSDKVLSLARFGLALAGSLGALTSDERLRIPFAQLRECTEC